MSAAAALTLDRASLRRIGPGGQARLVLDRASLSVPPGVVVGVLGANGAGKSSLLRLAAGTLAPSAGRVVRRGTFSWPVGQAGALHPDMTGAQNLRFVARLHGVCPRALEDAVEAVARLGPEMRRPVRQYSAGMRARLSFAAALSLSFDTYLVDEVTAVGDAAFRAESRALLRARLAGAGALVVSHSTSLLAGLCRAGIVLRGGGLHWHDDIGAAIADYRAGAEPVGDGVTG
ncbi:MAG: ATP-binding cassette domain-containing protein [Rhodobacteraceae bacterium]|nr:ATP-binding cassette domain-containing protein [Paracoccaceae bacterium]